MKMAKYRLADLMACWDDLPEWKRFIIWVHVKGFAAKNKNEAKRGFFSSLAFTLIHSFVSME